MQGSKVHGGWCTRLLMAILEVLFFYFHCQCRDLLCAKLGIDCTDRQPRYDGVSRRYK